MRDVRGRALVPTGGFGSCGTPAARGARMHCDLDTVFAPQPKGAALRLIVTAPSGRGGFPGATVVTPFRMP